MIRSTPDLFASLAPEAIAEIMAGSRLRSFAPGEELCREGDAASSVLVLERGAAEVLVGGPGHRLRRLRKGDVIGEIALITGEPRSATVRANVPTEAYEISRDAIVAVMANHPQLLVNLSRILSRRLARAHVEHVAAGRGEAVALVLGPSAQARLPAILAASAASSPTTVTSLGVEPGLATANNAPTAEAAAAALDELLSVHGFVFVAALPGTADLTTLIAQVDRTVIVGTANEVTGIVDRLGSPADTETVDLEAKGVAWLGRHLTRTKLGLALGAGGAKGYAHVGVLTVLEEAGYTVDAVAGSSIGALVGACIAMGMRSVDIDAVLHKRFSPEVVQEVFKLSFSGTSSGYATMEALTHDLAGGRAVSDLDIPFVALAADLNSRLPVALSSGPLADALLASTALAGLFPPFERDGQRLVDGLALVPVPVEAVIDSGADITVSVNLMSRDVLAAWPGEEPAPPPSGKQRMLETLLEVMDLTQLDASVRHASLADVVVTPRFGPCSWRDFHLADRFTTAGRAAALESLTHLRTLANPMHKGEAHG